MSLVRVIDYVANPGGGCRFVAEMLRAFRDVSDARFEVLTHGPGVERYRNLLGPEVAVVDHPPRNASRAFPPRASRIVRLLRRLAGRGSPDFHFDVPASATDGCDVVWLPWAHRHRLPSNPPSRVIASFHDCISLEFPGVLPERWRRSELETTRRLLEARGTRLLITSHATGAAIARLFPGSPATPVVVPLSSKHARPPPGEGAGRWPFSGGRYLLCPVNISPHKNLETLLEGFADWGARIPLVITGPGTDLRSRHKREQLLREVIARRGLVQGRDLFTLGYVADADYYAILDRAWALAMPTLAEGGGSFPVLEAVERGIPVISSDVPVMREMAERWNARLIWFDARSPSATVAALEDLERGYEEHRRAAAAQVPLLLQRSWHEVAVEYARAMGLS